MENKLLWKEIVFSGKFHLHRRDKRLRRSSAAKRRPESVAASF